MTTATCTAMLPSYSDIGPSFKRPYGLVIFSEIIPRKIIKDITQVYRFDAYEDVINDGLIFLCRGNDSETQNILRALTAYGVRVQKVFSTPQTIAVRTKKEMEGKRLIRNL